MKQEMATHPSILAWEIPWIEEPDRLQSMGSKELAQLSDQTMTKTHSSEVNFSVGKAIL